MKWAASITLLLSYFLTSAQNPSYTVSMSGIAEIKVGMKKTELEKLLNQTFKLPKTSKQENYERDTVALNYKGMDATVVFEKQEVNNQSEIVVWEVKSSFPQLKTRSGISIGDDKLKIISTYEGYLIYIVPEYEDSNFTIKSKTKATAFVSVEPKAVK